MRIIGGHDYFDSALAHGSDTSLVFQRQKIEDAPILPFVDSALTPMLKDTVSFHGRGRDHWRRESVVVSGKTAYAFIPQEIWLAGRRYGGIKVEGNPLVQPLFAKPEMTEWFWDVDMFMQFIASIDAQLRKGDEWTSKHSVTGSNISEHFDREPTRDETDWLIENHVSIAVWLPSISGRRSKRWREDTGWKINVDGLGKMGFARKLDPFTAFQELSMWIGGVLPRPGNPIVEITDEKVKVAKHGMDKWSFRTPPGNKGR